MKKNSRKRRRQKTEKYVKILYATKASYDNGETNCCAGKLTPDCHGNGSESCCNWS